MLTAIRKQARSWVVKALLLLLVLSFAIWGIGDIFYGNPEEEAVVNVGSAEITTGELNNAFNNSLANLQRQFGGQLDREQAIGIGLLQQTMQEQIGQRLVDLEAADMGLSVDDETLSRLIRENPNFQSAGRFDRFRFDQILRTTGLSEQGYLEVFRRELARSALTGSIAAAATVPDAQVDAIYRYRNEERRGRFVVIADAAVDSVDAPDDAALNEIYEANEVRFTAPEYRTITYVTLEPEDLLEEVEVTEEGIQAAYDDRAARYVNPEKRTIRQLLAPDQAIADKASALLEEGQSVDEVTEALKDDGVSLTELGAVTEDGMPAGIGTEAFAIDEGEVTDPVESPFGFHIFEVEAIEPEVVTPLEEVRDDIRRELALVLAEDRLPDLATQLDDELAAGLKVDEAARAVGMTASTVDAVDRDGRDQAGEPVLELEGWSALLQTAFEAAKDEPSLLEETDDGAYYVIQVDEIIERRLKDLDEVRDEVVALHEERQRREAAKARAEDIRTKLQEAASLESIAGDAGLEIQTIEPLKRSDDGAESGLNQAAVQALFATDEGAVADELIETEDGVLLVVVDEIIETAAGDAGEAREQLKAELERQVQADLLDQFGRALQNAHPIEINEAALTRLIEYDPADGYGGSYGGGGMAPGGTSPGMF